MDVNWHDVNSKLPTLKNEEQTKLRKKMFKNFDGNGNGYLSLAETDKGIRDVLKLDEVFHCKQVIMRAFQAAKDKYKSKSKYGPDYIELTEFRFFLVYLRQYFEYFVMFEKLDVTGDKKVTIDEFKQALPLLEKWGVKVSGVEETFKKISGGDRSIIFPEFCEWAIKQSLDLEDDEDFNDPDELK